MSDRALMAFAAHEPSASDPARPMCGWEGPIIYIRKPAHIATCPECCAALHVAREARRSLAIKAKPS